MEKFTLFWFRRDLRIQDNCGLFHALKGKNKVLPIFIFDTEILKKLPKQDARLEMILKALGAIDFAMKRNKCIVEKLHGTPKTILSELIKKWPIEKVVCNEDYEPYATKRDSEIKQLLAKEGITFETYKDQVIFAKDEVVKNDGTPYKVYTPFSKKWLERLAENPVQFYPSETSLGNLEENKSLLEVSLTDLGFEKSPIAQPQYIIDNEIIDSYEETRNFPALDKTSRLGAHLRFGTVSIRSLVEKAALRSNNTFLKELIWREFFMQILWHFPHTPQKSFKPQYDRIEWLNNPVDFEKWCAGETGFPLVDAGMRELNQTGFMHNRVRMLVGSFLCKHLLIDWRWGEAYFAEKLLDYEMSSNVGNWQWVAGCGVDAAPYFRIFNPSEQVRKFDKELKYIRQWVPNFQELDYPLPMVDHKFARERCLSVYKEALNA
ncbi:MAG: deoxyribodipyrimidine photo-lyase [Flavobacteriaceae bacterium]|jgi:deoxyribodipyrimidine photo-lyase|tara:strand:+ start:3020 stop:4321 length:1302 start_codon:yes stop_codon:yes gene_type:complete